MRNNSKVLVAVAGAAIILGCTVGLASASYHSEAYGGGTTNKGKRTSANVAAVIDVTSSLEFKPAKVTVTVGDTVQWRNVSPFGHTVTADASRATYPSNVALPEGVKPFDLSLRGGQSVRYTFDKPGVYRYVCLPHEDSGMLGTVEVKSTSQS